PDAGLADHLQLPEVATLEQDRFGLARFDDCDPTDRSVNPALWKGAGGQAAFASGNAGTGNATTLSDAAALSCRRLRNHLSAVLSRRASLSTCWISNPSSPSRCGLSRRSSASARSGDCTYHVVSSGRAQDS